jgi:hypothetical protein
MERIVKELEKLIEVFRDEFSGLDEQITSLRISQDKWTLKEIIGHLIDSASNNHQRFIRFQLAQDLEFPDYKNDDWLRVQKHQNMNFSDLLSLFYYYNKLIINVISNADKKCLNNKWNINWDENSTYITFGELITHYVEHMKLHLAHFNERLREAEDSLR